QVISERTGLKYSAASDDAGRFSFPRLPVGSYRLEATRQGFRQFLAEAIHLDSDQTRQANIVLEVGQVTEAVNVSGAVALVETVGGTIKEIVDQRRMVDLPLNGRNPLQLQLLVPGAVSSTGTVSLGQNTAISVNGARGIANNYMLDGGDNNDPLTNTASLLPNPDALEEFSILTNNYSAEYGRNSGAVVNAITRSGTNQYHGGFYEFLRNDTLDSRSFFGLQKSKLRRNQFGATLGGPVLLPKLYRGRDRTFFFFSFEGVRDRRGDTFSSLVVPTALERRGDFSQSTLKPLDPVSRVRFPNDQVPANRFDAAAVKFIEALVPLPNIADGRHIFNRPEELDSNQVMGRGDHMITNRQRLMIRGFYDWSTQFLTAGLPLLQSSVGFNTSHFVANHTYTLRPNLLNTAQFSFGRVDLKRGPLPVAGGVTYQSLGMRVVSDTPEYPQNWRGSVTGYWNLAQDNLVYIDRKTPQGSDTVSWISGAHMVKFGGEVRTTMSDRLTANLTDPQFTFDGRFSTNPLADFLLGRPSVMNQGSLRKNEARSRAFSLFLQDDWKVRRNLTLSFGLRYDPFFPFYDAADQFSVFRPGVQSQVFPSAPAGLLYIGDSGVTRGGARNDSNNLAPRFGFAWTPFRGSRTSVRGAYGVFYDTPRHYTLTAFANTQPYSLQLNITQPPSFSDPYAGRTIPFPFKPPSTPEERRNFRYTFPVVVGESIDPDLAAAYSQQWNLNVQREIRGQVVLSAGYVGAKGTRLSIQRELNPAVFGPGATTGNVDARRIYAPSFGSINSFDSIGCSTYHALQLSLNKRYSRGVTVLANYTFGKSIDDASLDEAAAWQNPLNLRPEKALSTYDVRHRFVTSFLWETPSPKSGPARAILGNWQWNGIVTIQSGTPFNVISGRDQALTGAGTQRPNLAGDPHLDTGRSRDELLARYFNPTAFTLPATGSFGNSGKNILIGPGNYNVDFSVFRIFPVAEQVRIQFRTEFFNLFNHANLTNPVSNISSATVGRIQSTTGPRILQFGLRVIY
ncbi:MAG: carboxypeptidase regulatory-like domain-containing protein, partial [Bryobacteraceae bacterium]